MSAPALPHAALPGNRRPQAPVWELRTFLQGNVWDLRTFLQGRGLDRVAPQEQKELTLNMA